jgi:hypothetical protein
LEEEVVKGKRRYLQVLGFDLAELGPFAKNVIGLSLIGLIALLAVYALKSLDKSKDKVQKKKKEKKN